MSRNLIFFRNTIKKAIECSSSNQVRYSSFQSSHKVRPLEEYPEVQVVKDPKLWKFVEDILPQATVPKLVKKAEYPTTWQPPKESTTEKDYFVARTKNHMIPVYLQVSHRGLRRITSIRKIQGNLWTLEKQVSELVKKSGKRYAGRVNEMSGILHIHGDHVVAIRNFLMEKGF
ncbi:MRPL49 family protein [Megaselia abdita]